MTAMSTITADRALTVVRAPEIPDPAALANTLAQAGIRAVELTFTTPGVLDHLRAASGSEAVLGVGTVLTGDQARAAIDAGAKFLVTPGIRADVAAVASDAAVPVIMGAFTPTEVLVALDLGAAAVKIFPAGALGPGYFKDLRGPFPDVALIPSGGVNASNAADFLARGAVAVSAGTDVVPPQLVAAGDWPEIASRAAIFVKSLNRKACIMTSAVDWLRTTTPGLLVLCGLAIAILLFTIIKVKLEPFIALLLTGLGLALAAGLPVGEIVGTAIKSGDSLLETGFGSILGHIAVIIGLGTVLGAILERSGGADVLARKLLGIFGERGAPVAMGLLGLIFGIPVFFDIGIFVLAPLIYVTAKRGGKSLVLYVMPMVAGLSMTHAFLPPHPGPVALGGLLEISLGWLILMGFVCGIPGFIAAGIVWGSYIGKRVIVEVPPEFLVERSNGSDESEPPSPAGGSGTMVKETPAKTSKTVATSDPSVGTIVAIIAVPLVLILGATFGTMLLDEGSALLQVLTFFGTPAVALLIAVLIAFYVLGIRRGASVQELSVLTGESLRPVGMLLLVVGAGAFFGKVISATGIGDALADTMSAAGLPVIVLAYVISCGLRIAQGSATVAIVTTGGIVAPLVAEGNYSQMGVALIAMAIAAGSIILSHVNDGGFWIIAKYFNMTVKQTLQTWTVLETILSVVSFAVAAALFALFV